MLGLSRTIVMNIRVLQIAETAQKAEAQAEFGKPFDESMRVSLLKSGMAGPAHQAKNCMGWVWRQWLLGTSKELISKKIEPFVARGLEMRALCRSYHKLALHDLYLLNCSIFGSSESQLNKVAESVADSYGDKGETPIDDGELYAAAWCGMLKNWILGNTDNAFEQSHIIWKSHRESGVFAAPKPLVIPWLRKDWKAFFKAQKSDFEKLWKRARKDGWTVRAENPNETVVTTDRYQIDHQWCWAHCGMAVLAHRLGNEVATDPLWFPSAAIAAKPEGWLGIHRESPDQLKMF